MFINYLLTLTGLSIISCLALYFIRKRMYFAKEKKLSTLINEITNEIRTIDEMENILQRELQYKTQESTSFSLHLIQKNEMLDQLRSEIELIRKSADGEMCTKLGGILKSADFKNTAENDWNNFRQNFEEVHKGFITKLKENFPLLNDNDIKLCALLKLNFNTKQISSILDITPDSTKVARYRLRKKLGISTETKITDFLTELEEKEMIAG
jgi:hypothetical protein